MDTFMQKNCRICTQLLPVTSFDKWRSQCKSCRGKQQALRPNYHKQRWEIRGIHFTLEQYLQMFSEQNGVCKICKKPDKKKLAVDHDHTTGRIRGLLCYSCNLHIGWYENRKPFVQDYLEEGDYHRSDTCSKNAISPSQRS